MTRNIPLCGPLRGPVTLAPVGKRLAVVLLLPVSATYLCSDSVRISISRMRSTNRGNAEVDVNDYRQVCMGKTLCFYVIKMDYYYFYLNFFNAKKE